MGVNHAEISRTGLHINLQQRKTAAVLCFQTSQVCAAPFAMQFPVRTDRIGVGLRKNYITPQSNKLGTESTASDELQGGELKPQPALDDSEYMEFEEDPPGHRFGFVAIIGRPNAGKSTLLNRLLEQQLSVVTAKAQTTRHRIVGIWSSNEHQAIILDTPGIIKKRRDKLEDKMMEAVDEAVRDADVVLAIVDASFRPEKALDILQPGQDWKGPPFVFVLNKIDLMSDMEIKDVVAKFEASSHGIAAVIPISAASGEGLDMLQEYILKCLPEGPSMYPKDTIAEAPERFFVAEIVRKHVFLQYREELPYQVAVDVVEFKERKPPAKVLIRANVIVEKDRHRGILLGKKGSAIKALSTASRIEIEEFLGRGVYLDLSVKVIEAWRKDPKQLQRLGY